MMEYDEDDFLLLSGIQHFVFCKRQWALIHIEQQWYENVRTIEGEILHEKTHDETVKEKRGEMIISRGMKVFSRKMGVTGTCDVVELHENAKGVTIFGREGTYKPVPIEYKREKPKENESDILQLSEQAMCLEEMLLCEIPEGFLYYGEIKRRIKIEINNELRHKVQNIFSEMHDLYGKKYTPKVKVSKSCKACSIAEVCIPKLCKNPSALYYIKRNIEDVEQ